VDRKIYFLSALIVAGMFMTLLDTTIVDIILPHMMSAFEAKPDDIQWVITSYMIASAVAMPVVGWLGGKLGHRNTYLSGIGLFTLMSALCGIAPNLETMILGRVLQGVGEGLAVPMSMALLFELYPPEKRGMAMGMFALGATFGPSLGPTLGGYLTEHLDWRWVFYVNLLPGILVVYLLTLLMKDDRKEHITNRKLDVPGFALLAISLSSLITALSKGNDWGWSDEKTILLLYAFFISSILFIFVELTVENPLVNLNLFKFKFFRYPVLSLTLFGMGVYASYFLLPLYLEKLREFPTMDAGEILFWPAAATGVVSVLAGFLMDRKIINHKTSIITGILIFTYGTYLQGKIDLDMGKMQIIFLLLPWGAGMGFFFPALSQVSLGNFQGEFLRQASSLQNLLRLVGGSVGTAISTHILITSQDNHFLKIVEKSSWYSPQLTEFTAKLKSYLYYVQSTPEPFLNEKAKALVEILFNQHAFWHSFGDAFFFASVCGILTLIPALLMEEKIEEATSSDGSNTIPVNG
jgi:DHA2 family multidrug resistance protein